MDGSSVSATAQSSRADAGVGVSAPLRHPVFRGLWMAALVSNIGTWMQNVGAAWLMTDLSASPLMVALVQAATSLPMFFLAVIAGALADIVDRRRMLLFSQSWMLAVAGVLTVLTWMGLVTPWVLLTMTFLLGVGYALNAPARQAIIPELVPREELAPAISLNSVAMNVARAIGPALGGIVVAMAGPAAAFGLNALSFLGVLVVLQRWRRPVEESLLPAERLLGAVRAGIRYVRYAPAIRTVILRALLFIVAGSSLWALLPVITRTDPSRGPLQYGILLACFGGGAALGATLLSRHFERLTAEQNVLAGTVVLALAIFGIAWVPFYPAWCAMLVPAGVAWVRALITLTVSAQLSLPRWVQARGLAVYLLAFNGGIAIGSVVWGDLATEISPKVSLSCSAACLLVSLAATRRFPLPTAQAGEFDPSRHWGEFTVPPKMSGEHGPVLVEVEYWVAPARCNEFVEAMHHLRRARLRDGAVRWHLFQDAEQPGRFVEMFLSESIVEHLRQHERVTFADKQLQERVREFLLPETQPIVRHLVGGFRGGKRRRGCE